jgi:septal ring factor EnvC (AmiA/AmiB activator)
MAADPVLEYWAEIMRRTPVTPEVMAQWKRLLDHGIEAWSRALSEVMATEEFAQLLGASIEQWLAAQASITGNRAQPAALTTQLTAVTTQLTALAAQLSRLEERIGHVEERIASMPESTVAAASVPTPRRGRRRRAA